MKYEKKVRSDEVVVETKEGTADSREDEGYEPYDSQNNLEGSREVRAGIERFDQIPHNEEGRDYHGHASSETQPEGPKHVVVNLA